MDRQNRTPIRIAILGVLVAAFVFAIYSSLSGNGEVAVGDTAPNFRLPMLDGTEKELADFKGKGVVLNFWGSWCEPCKREMPDLERVHQQFKDQGVVVTGINIGESQITAQAFAKQMGVTFPIWLDQKREITQLYKIGPIPTTFFIDKDGEIQDIYIGQMTEAIITEKVNKIKP